MKRILITGAAGFIGSTLTNRIINQGHYVIAIDNFNNKKIVLQKERIPYQSHSGYTFYEADIRDRAKMLEIFHDEKPDSVVHLAGRAGVYNSFPNAEEYYAVNVTGTHNILEACRAASVSNFIFASSFSLYGDSTLPVTEDTPLPILNNPYVKSKRLAELNAQAYSEIFGLKVTILRIFSVYGPHQRSETAIHKFAHLIDSEEFVPVYGDGSAQRDFIYIDNCVSGILKTLEHPFQFEIFNLGEQHSTTLNEIIRLLSSYLGKNARVQYTPTPEGIPTGCHADIRKIRKMLGYNPIVSIEDGLYQFVRWYQETK